MAASPETFVSADPLCSVSARYACSEFEAALLTGFAREKQEIS
jgi:hypothetical protein